VLAAAAERLETPGTARYLFRPNFHSRGKNAVPNFLSRTKPSCGVPRLSMARLRATWLVDLFDSSVPVTVIVAAAGVTTLTACPVSCRSSRGCRPTRPPPI
jgi:hypothetical protein